MALAAARAADEKKGEDILVLDLRGRSQCADFFVIVTGRVEAHLSAIVKGTQEALAALGARALGRGESAGSSGWALLDYGPVVVHAFVPEIRNYYDLELLWGDAPRLAWWEGLADSAGATPG
jgi:ribosome-associated protein